MSCKFHLLATPILSIIILDLVQSSYQANTYLLKKALNMTFKMTLQLMLLLVRIKKAAYNPS